MRKIASGTTTEYIYSVDGSVVAEKVGATWSKGYVYLGGQLLAQYSNSTTYFVHKDHLGSSRVLTRVDKSVHETLDFLPFGEQLNSNSTTTHKFTGKERDAESGLDFFGARFYASLSGRFISADLPFIDQHPGNPQTWNLYSYARNNPLGFVDPTGNANICAGGGEPASCQLPDGGSDLSGGPSPTQYFDADPEEEPQQGGNNQQPGAGPVNPLNNSRVGRILSWWVDGDRIALAAQNMASSETKQGKIESGAAFLLLVLVAINPVKGGKAVEKGTAWGAKYVTLLIEKGEQLYPKLAGKFNLHHVVPKYLGGAIDGARVRIPAAYHQLITNEFRKRIPHGQAHLFTPEQIKQAIKEVYARLPIPKY